MADPVTLAAAASRVLTYASIAFGGGSLSKQEKRALEASGARGIRGAFRLPDGSMVSRDRAIAIGSAILAGGSPPIAPGLPPVGGSPIPAPIPGVPGTPPQTLPGRLPPRPGPISIPDRIPGRPAVGAAGGVLSRVLGNAAFWLFYPREAGRGSELCVRGPYGLVCPPIVASALPEALPGRGPRRRPRVRPGVLDTPRRRERRRPIASPADAPPREAGRPYDAAASSASVQYLPEARVIEAIETLPRPSPGITVPQTAPATATRTSSATSSATAASSRAASNPLALSVPAVLAGLTTLVRGVPATRPLTLSPTIPAVRPLPAILPSSSSFPQSALAPAQALGLTSANARSVGLESDLDRTCRERARRRRKKRKERTVCYRGSYTETRSGTIKRRKEKIRCR